jgi:uncharacterized protein YcfJ
VSINLAGAGPDRYCAGACREDALRRPRAGGEREMAEERKPKIDLKARLGKKTVSSPSGPTIPPPVGIPRPSGIPAPPFAGPAGAAPSRPKVDASNPYAAIAADEAPIRAEPQAIKVELSEEVVQHQRKSRAKVAVLAVITAVIGALLGYALGGSRARAEAAEATVAGAEQLVKEVDDANGKVDELAEVLKAAQAKLKDNTYPDEEVKKLGGIDIPFSGANLAGKSIGRLKSDVVTLLITFASGAQEANDGKNKIQSLLAGAKPAIEDLLAQQANPKVRWAVYFENGPLGPWVSMQSLPEPFFAEQKDKDKAKGYKWPDEFKIPQGGKTFTLKRYSSGDPTKAKSGEPYIVPVNPATQGSVCPSDVASRIARELRDLEEVLRGDKTPGQEKDGLIDTGKTLVDKLKQVGKP